MFMHFMDIGSMVKLVEEDGKTATINRAYDHDVIEEFYQD